MAIALFILVGCRFLVVQATAAASGSDPCLNGSHRILADSESRSSSFDIPAYQPACCDRRLKASWYRAQNANGGDVDMPTSCVKGERCGTLYPIWMNGSIPLKDGNIHNRTVALSYEGICSLTIMTIQVKNCGTYRVYYLTSLDVCPAAYCFGDNLPNTGANNRCYDPTTTTPAPSTTTPRHFTSPDRNTADNLTTPGSAEPEDIPVVWIVVIVGMAVCMLLSVAALIMVVLKRSGRSSVTCGGDKDQPPPYSSSHHAYPVYVQDVKPKPGL